MKAPPGTPYDCDAPGYSGEKPKTVWGSMVRWESPARMEPRGRWKISAKFFVNYHLETLPLIPAQPNTFGLTVVVWIIVFVFDALAVSPGPTWNHVGPPPRSSSSSCLSRSSASLAACQSLIPAIRSIHRSRLISSRCWKRRRRLSRARMLVLCGLGSANLVMARTVQLVKYCASLNLIARGIHSPLVTRSIAITTP